MKYDYTANSHYLMLICIFLLKVRRMYFFKQESEEAHREVSHHLNTLISCSRNPPSSFASSVWYFAPDPWVSLHDVHGG